jgi:pimeloyl-ACP methyl ester carboxylesterase
MGKGRFLVRLPNHRYLDVYESGPPDAPVLLYHHPGLTSCLPSRLLEAAVHRYGLRFVAASRPGYADSTRLPGRSVSAVVYDSAAVLDALGVERCLMAGW